MWRLLAREHVERHQIAGSLTCVVRRRETVFGDEHGLFTAYEGDVHEGADEHGSIPFGTKYLWPGGADNVTDDPRIRDLWLAHGFDVEQVS